MIAPAGAKLDKLREAFRDYARTVVSVHAQAVDGDHRFPSDAIEAARSRGLMGLLVPARYGGAGLDHVAFTVAIEEIARACASTAVILDVQNSVACEPILLFGTEEQRRAWLPRLAGGELLGGFALTEPGSGSDAAALETAARQVGAEWVLTGTKVFITNAGRAGVYIVFARTGPGPRAAGVSAFIVPAEAVGVRVGQIFRKMGLNGSPTGELVLEEARVPAANLLHEQGGGFAVAMRALDSGRIGISGQALGIAQAALDEAVGLARGGSGLGQGAAFVLADMATRLAAGRELAHHAAALCSAGRPFTKEASMAKLYCTDTAMEIASAAVEMAGMEGHLAGSSFERHFRDAKALQIYEGTNQIQRLVIGRSLLAS